MKIVQIKPGFWREDRYRFRRYTIWIHGDRNNYHTKTNMGWQLSDFYIQQGVRDKEITVIMEDKDE